MKKKKFLSILLILAMCLQLWPSAAFAATEVGPEEAAAEADTAYALRQDAAFLAARTGDAFTVDYTVQKDGAFLMAPQLDQQIDPQLAESYGYTDKVTDGVSALDVLVAAHVAKYGGSFTSATAQGYLTLDENGKISKMFAQSGNCGFVVNRFAPADEAVNAAPVKESVSLVEFFFYQENDEYLTFVLHPKTMATYNNYTNAYSYKPKAANEQPTNYYLAGGNVRKTVGNTALKGNVEPKDGMQLYLVDAATGELTSIADAVTGSQTIDDLAAGGVQHAWTETGKFLLTAKPVNGGDNYLLPLCRLWVMERPKLSNITFYANSSDYAANKESHPEGTLFLTADFNPEKLTGQTLKAPDYLNQVFVAVTADGVEGIFDNGTKSVKLADGTGAKLMFNGSTNNYKWCPWPKGYLDICFSASGIGNISNYKINVEQYTTLKNILIADTALAGFNRDELNYTVSAAENAQSLKIAVEPFDNSYTVTVGGRTLNKENNFTADVPINWNGADSLTLDMVVTPAAVTSTTEAKVQYVTQATTYHLILQKVIVGNKPAVLVQPRPASYNRTTKPLDLPKLSVNAVANGTLQYQWFKAASAESYDNAQEIAGANGSVFTAPVEKENIGDNYYFCRITNTGEQNDNVTDSAIVKVEIIPDYTPVVKNTNTNIPKIEGYPEEYGFVYEQGQTEGLVPLTFEATSEVPAAMDKADKWSLSVRYITDKNNTNDSKFCGSEKGVQKISFTPPTAVANETGYYYLVQASHLDGKYWHYNKDDKGTYVFVYIKAKAAEAPTITKQPQGAEYQEGASKVARLSCDAKAPASGGKLSWQWYSNSKPSQEGAQPVAQGYSFTPGVSVPGTTYYYAVITNTLQGKTAQVTSDFAEVKVLPNDDNPLRTLSGNGTQAEPYQISTAADFAVVQQAIAAGISTNGLVFSLQNDIDMPADWSGLGGLKPGATDLDHGKNILAFSGVIEGNNHTLTFAEGSKALLCYAREVSINNLNIYAPYMADYALLSNYVVDYGEDGVYETGCPNVLFLDNVNLKSGSVIMKGGYLGGGASGANYCSIKNCTVEENVKIGFNKTTGQSSGLSAVGSFAGEFNGGIQNCVSYAEVYGRREVGGLVGKKAQSMGSFAIRNSAFLGRIEATGDRVGGIAGAGYISVSAPNTPPATITNCYVAADISGQNIIGGIFGDESGLQNALNEAQVCDNFFYGSLTASDAGAIIGGIAGWYGGVGKLQDISNNYFYDKNGAAKTVIGRVDKYEFATEEERAEYIAKQGAAKTAAEFADGTVLALLNAGNTKNWGQGELYPVHDSSKATVTELTVSGDYKTEYTVGEELDLTGAVFTAKWSNGTTTNLTLADVTVEGFDKNKASEQKLTVKYLGATAAITVTVKPQPGTIKVHFSLLGDTAHGTPTEATGAHTLKAGNLAEWLADKEYTIDSQLKIKDLLEKILTENGLTWENDIDGNYIKSITKDGVTLAEFTNGAKSGWQYTLNGSHPQLGINEQFMQDGDVIIFHYTDDYTQESAIEDAKPDKASLQALISSAEQLKAEEYTAASWEKLQTALTAAKAAAAKENATADEIAAAQAALQAAVSSLQKAQYPDLRQTLQNTLAYIARTAPAPAMGTTKGEWSVLALARGNYAVEAGYYDAYYNRIVEAVKATPTAPKLHEYKPTENERVILALSAIGKDATNVGGYNLLAPLADLAWVNSQGVNSTIYALIALDTRKYDNPGQDTRQQLIKQLLAEQLANGGFPLTSGGAVDNDVTGMALQALAPYKEQAEVKAAIDRALQYLASIQNENGGFGDNIEVNAQAIVALSALGIDAQTDQRFAKEGGNPITAMLNYQAEGGGFKHVMEQNTANAMATDQAAYALAAYFRLLDGQNSLYDMSDAKPNESGKPSEPGKPDNPNTPAGPGADPNKIKVYFTLYGDSLHGAPTGDKDTHTLKNKNLQTWIANKAYTVDLNATVKDVFEMALTEAGMTWRNPSGNYVEAITYNGVTLAEFSNGNRSGWMYTLNGEHSDKGVSEQFLENNDKIVWHYTDDYTIEKGSEQWGGGSGGAGGSKGTGDNAGSIVLQPGTVEGADGKNLATMTAKEITKAIEGAKDDSLNNIVIEPNVKGSAANVALSLPVDSLKAIGDAKMGLSMNSRQGSLAIPAKALEAIAAQAGGIDVRLNVESKDTKVDTVKTAVNNALTQAAASLRGAAESLLANASVTEVTITSNNQAITSFDGHELTVSLPVANRDLYTEGENYKVVVISADGKLETLIGKCVKYNGQIVVQVKVSHLSTFIVTNETEKEVTTQGQMSFADVTADKWFYEAVKFAYEAGLMNGEGTNTFNPNGNLNRAMLVTILYRLEQSPAVTESSKFSDVAAGQWYTEAVIWASENGIVNGYENGTFAPTNKVSREEMAAMLMRYAEFKGIDVSAGKDLSGYSDAGKVAGWAKPNLSWANSAGLIQGDENNNLNPQGKATRAEAAMILMRLVKNVLG